MAVKRIKLAGSYSAEAFCQNLGGGLFGEAGVSFKVPEAPRDQSARFALPYNAFMSFLTRRRLLVAVPLSCLLMIALIVFLFVWGQDLKSRSALISAGMSREQVEDMLGPSVLALGRAGGRGVVLIWTDQLWQVDVLIGPDGRTESISCKPSDSFCRRTVGRLISLPE